METDLRRRFWPKVLVLGPHECWPWLGAVRSHGYGVLAGATQELAHRVSHELNIGPIPEGLQVDHVRARGCTRRDCVNPHHLEAVTPRENTRRSDAGKATGARNRAKTHCPRGHPYDEANTYVYRHPLDGDKRQCRVCKRDHEMRARRRAERGD